MTITGQGRKTSASRKQGFSLMELLVVICVAAILAALLFPVFSTARARARQTSCLSSLSQVGQSIALYVQDYDEAYPRALHAWWRQHPDPLPGMPGIAAQVPRIPLIQDVLQPYCHSREIFRCPADIGIFPQLAAPVQPSVYAVYGSSYDFIPWLQGETAGCFSRPAELVSGNDFSGEWHSWQGADFWNLRVNALYYDGHVKSILSQDERPGIACDQ